jgi:diguanylate cyclase (GGDEF)-like protein
MTNTRGATMRQAIRVTDEPRPGSLTSRLHASTTVLVVEDESDIAGFLGAYFRASGLALVHVDPDSPADVVDAVRTHQPNCMLLDLRLRGFSGIDVYRAVRDDASLPDFPVIMVTADSREDSRSAALSGGIDAYVTKPFHVNDLYELVLERIARAGVADDVPHQDALTGVVTHARLAARLGDEVAAAGAGEGTVAFALVQLRSLRDINARAGHAAGDYVLRAVASALLSALPAPIVIGRNAGDEFGVLFPGLDTIAASAQLAAALAAAEAPVALPGGQEVPVLLRAGVAAFPEHASDADALYMSTDVALARAVEADRRLASPV